jgi:hypothetical protein
MKKVIEYAPVPMHGGIQIVAHRIQCTCDACGRQVIVEGGGLPAQWAEITTKTNKVRHVCGGCLDRGG